MTFETEHRQRVLYNRSLFRENLSDAVAKHSNARDAGISYQFLVHHGAPVDGGRALSTDQVVDVLSILSKLQHSVA